MPQFGALVARLEELVGVVPIIPALEAFWILVPAILLSALTALASLRHPQRARQLLLLIWRQKLPIALLFTAFGLACILVGWALAQLDRSNASRPRDIPLGSGTQTGNWPTDRGSLLRRGAEPGAVGPTGGGLVWSARLSGAACYSSPTIVGDRLYIVGSIGDRGTIHCLDIQSGELIWSCRPPGMRATFSSPVVQGRYLVCGEGLHHTRMARVTCVDITRGRVLWTFRTQSHVECTPVIAGSRVYVGAGDDGVYCLDLEPSTPEAGRLIWHVPGKRLPDAETSLAVHEGRVYVGLGVGGEAVCVLDAQNGKQLVRRDMPYPVFGPPSIANGRMYVGMGAGDYAGKENQGAGQVVCFELPGMRTRWVFATEGSVLGAVALAGATGEDARQSTGEREENERSHHGEQPDAQLIFGCGDGHVYVLDREGTLLARRQTGSPIVASPAVTDEHVYVVNQSGELWALGRGDLQPVWQHQLASRGRFVSDPVVADGSLFVGTEFDGVQRVGRPPEVDTRPLWPGRWGGAGYAGCRDASRLPAKVQVAWTYPVGESKEASKPVFAAPFAVAGDTLVVPVAAGSLRGLLCLELDTSAEKGSRARWHQPFPQELVGSPAIVGERIFCIEGRRGSEERRLHCLAADTGAKRWSVPISPAAPGHFTADHQGIVIADQPGRLSHWDLQGNRLWSREVGALPAAAALSSTRLFLATAQPPALLALDRPSGHTLWSVEIPALPTTTPVIDADRLILGTRRGLEIRSLIDGDLLSRSPPAVGRIDPPLFVSKQRIIAPGTEGRLWLLRHSDAELLASIDCPAAESEPLSRLLVGRDALLCAGRESFWRMEQPAASAAWSRWPTTVRPSRSAPASETGSETTSEVPFEAADRGGTGPGASSRGASLLQQIGPQRVTTAMVLHRGHVYFGLTGEGVVCLKVKQQR